MTGKKLTASECLDILKEFFEELPLDMSPIRLDAHTMIESPQTFVRGHLEFCTANIDKQIALPYLARLWKLKEILESKPAGNKAEKAKQAAAPEPANPLQGSLF